MKWICFLKLYISFHYLYFQRVDKTFFLLHFLYWMHASSCSFYISCNTWQFDWFNFNFKNSLTENYGILRHTSHDHISRFDLRHYEDSFIRRRKKLPHVIFKTYWQPRCQTRWMLSVHVQGELKQMIHS